MSIAQFFSKLFSFNKSITTQEISVIEQPEADVPTYVLPEWFTDSYSLVGLDDITVKIYSGREVSLNDEIALLNVIDFSLFKLERHIKDLNNVNVFSTSDEAAQQFVHTISSNWGNLNFLEISGLDKKTGTIVTYLISQNIQFALVIFDEDTEDGRIFDHYLIRHNGRSIKSTDYTVIEGLFDLPESPAKNKAYVEL